MSLTNAPLFEKLIDEDIEYTSQIIPKSFLSENEMREAIVSDLSKLLNTRVAPFWENYIERKSVLHPFSYGINIIDNCSIDNTTELRILEMRIVNVIKKFEPRLTSITVQLQETGNDVKSLVAFIEAYMIFENCKLPFSFPIVLGL